jgi:hypothetical protein
MAIRILIYGQQGEGSAQAAMSQIRALVGEMRIDASVQMVTDPSLLASNGVDRTPAVNVDGLFISTGWVPSRNEIARALRSRLSQVDTMHGAGPDLPHKRKKH